MELRAWYGNSSTEDDERIALIAIKRAKTMDGWIECACVSTPLKPLLAPIQQEKFPLRHLTPKVEEPHQHEGRPEFVLNTQNDPPCDRYRLDHGQWRVFPLISIMKGDNHGRPCLDTHQNRRSDLSRRR